MEDVAAGNPISRAEECQSRMMVGSSVFLSVAVVCGAILVVSCTRARPEPRHLLPVQPASKLSTEQPVEVCPENRLDEPIAVCNLASSGAFEVRNQSDQPVDVLTRVEVETRTGNNSWAVTSALVYLIDDCGQDPPKMRCTTLPPGARFRPKPWSGFTCSGQCGLTCSGDHPLRGWPLRFAVTSCAGTQRFVGPVFAPPEFEDVPL